MHTEAPAKPGIDTFEIRKDQQPIERFTRDEALPIIRSQQATSPPEVPEVSDVSRRNTVLRLVKPSFRRGNKYHVTEGDIEFQVSIEDQRFLDDVDNGRVSFSADGRLRVVLRQEVIPGTRKDTVEHFVEQVIAYERSLHTQQIESPKPDQEDSSPLIGET